MGAFDARPDARDEFAQKLDFVRPPFARRVVPHAENKFQIARVGKWCVDERENFQRRKFIGIGGGARVSRNVVDNYGLARRQRFAKFVGNVFGQIIKSGEINRRFIAQPERMHERSIRRHINLAKPAGRDIEIRADFRGCRAHNLVSTRRAG